MNDITDELEVESPLFNKDEARIGDRRDDLDFVVEDVLRERLGVKQNGKELAVPSYVVDQVRSNKAQSSGFKLGDNSRSSQFDFLLTMENLLLQN